jgi:hypothetical protein
MTYVICRDSAHQPSAEAIIYRRLIDNKIKPTTAHSNEGL